MGEQTGAFVKGGCGCLIAFFVLGFLASAMGGHISIDAFGLVCLFVIGGILGLIVLMVFNKGKAAGQAMERRNQIRARVDDDRNHFS